MEENLQSLSDGLPDDIRQVLNSVSQPGVIFHTPYREGEKILIGTSRLIVKNKGVSVSPHALIVVSPKGVEILPIPPKRKPSIILALFILAIIGTIPVIYAPPWRPEFNLFDEVRKLIRTIRNGE